MCRDFVDHNISLMKWASCSWLIPLHITHSAEFSADATGGRAETVRLTLLCKLTYGNEFYLS